jgi:hypothetical protein
MPRHGLARVICTAAVLVGAAVTLSSSAREAFAQETKCYYVVCTGNVCVYEEVECPKPTGIKPST